MKATIFYSWQSDTRAASNRTLIQDAPEGAVREPDTDGSLAVGPVIERDTQGIPGAPDISMTILEKIDASAALIADVTIVGRGRGERPTPNPNLLIELGCGLKALGSNRVISTLTKGANPSGTPVPRPPARPSPVSKCLIVQAKSESRQSASQLLVKQLVKTRAPPSSTLPFLRR